MQPTTGKRSTVTDEESADTQLGPGPAAPTDDHVGLALPTVRWAVPLVVLAAVGTLLIALRPHRIEELRTRVQQSEIMPHTSPSDGH